MKKFVRLPILTYFSCSENSNNHLERNQAELIESLENHLSQFVETTITTSKDFDKKAVLNELDHSKNYEESIFNLITREDKNINVPPVKENTLLYSKYNEFDKYLLKNLVDDFMAESLVTFVQKANHYLIFVDNNIDNLAQREYLKNNIEQFKWVKYSVYIGLNDKKMAPSYAYNEGCFDDCMEDAIEEQFDWWGGWVEFIAAPGPVVAWMAGECIYDCHF